MVEPSNRNRPPCPIAHAFLYAKEFQINTSGVDDSMFSISPPSSAWKGDASAASPRGLETASPRSTIAPNPIAWPQLTTQFPRVNLELYDAKRPGPVADRLGSERNTVGSTCVVGLQWGDEAKGKIVDLLCDQHDVVVRYQGGANAGHTVVHEGVTYKLSLVPTGVLRQGIDCVIGNGVVIHPPALLAEIERLSAQGVAFGDRLHISDRAHVILPYHLAEERLTEESSSKADHLGTTRRGIGPCYRDKVGRVHGVRVTDLFHPSLFRERLDRIVAFKNRLLAAMLPDFEPFDAAAVAEEYLQYAERLRPFVCDTTAWLHEAIARGKRLLFEGAQGSLLDVDHGSYPYVTSSNSSAAGIAAGSGVPTRHIDRWIGIVKAYTDARRRRAVSHRAGQRDRRANPPGRPRVRHRDQPAPAVRLVRRRGRPLLGAGQRRDRDRHHAS